MLKQFDQSCLNTCERNHIFNDCYAFCCIHVSISVGSRFGKQHILKCVPLVFWWYPDIVFSLRISILVR